MTEQDKGIVFARADKALSEGEYEEALDLTRDWAEGPAPDPRASSLFGLAYFYVGEYEVAEPHLTRGFAAAENDWELLFALGITRFHLGDLSGARDLLSRLVGEEPESAEAHYWLGRVLEWGAYESGASLEEAQSEYSLAAEIDPEGFPLSTQLTEEEFREVIERAIDDLPPRVLEATEDLVILSEPIPRASLLTDFDGPFGPDLLGLYTGVPLPSRSNLDSGRPPDIIYLFRRNLEAVSRDREQLHQEIRVTLIHEIGHYLGLSEADLGELGLE